MAMHCPQCLTEYRDGFKECADCHVPLASGPPPASQSPAVGHAVDLVTVLQTTDHFAADLAKATLQDAGIEYVMAGDDPAERGLTGMSPMGAAATRFQVESARAEEARELLEPIIHPEPISEEEGA